MSNGYHHPDEHFQIIEFAWAWLGNAPLSELPWEYEARIRPWLQPFAMAGVIQVSGLVGIEDPFAIARLARFVSGALGWLSSLFLVALCFRWLDRPRLLRWGVGAATLIWFLPYQHVRMSSENWAASVFLIGFALLVLTRERVAIRWSDLGIGLLFGLAFEFRYQVGIMVAGAVIWAALFGGLHLRRLAVFAGGVVLVVAVATVIDRIGYGEWVIAPWRYLVVNVVEGKAAEFSVDPWYHYIKVAVGRGIVPVGLILLMGPVYSWLATPRHLVTGATLPFFLAHQVLAHKEARFLFPIAILAPIQFLLGWRARPVRVPPGLVNAALTATLVVNAALTLGATLRTAEPNIAFLRRVNRLASGDVLSPGLPLYNMGWAHTYSFYRSPEIRVVRTGMAEAAAIAAREGPRWLFVESFDPPPEFLAAGVDCARRAATAPEWTITPTLRPVLRAVKVREWALFECG